MKPTTDLDYVELYAKKLKNDKNLFQQQKILIESQLHSSRAVFSKFGTGDKFKAKAREYLKGTGLV
ncbi:Uncharacterised protein [uncultured archaeon]|nr:Uncharacterised protein [uncultured archaeon]